MEEDKTLTGTIQIHFETDGDFGFSDYENINNYGWVIYHEDGMDRWFDLWRRKK